MFKMKIVTE